MAKYAYIAGTTNDDTNDNGSIACQLDYLKQTGEHYDDYFIDTFNGLCQARFQLQKLLMVVKPGDVVDVMDVSSLTSNVRELYCLLDYLEDIHVTVYSDMLILDDICMHEWCTALMLCKADRITRSQHNFNHQKMC